MAGLMDFPARGKVTAVRDGIVVFAPSGTNYELHLLPEGGSYQGPTGVPVEGVIRAKARKVWTVPSGGSFITPLSGSPRIIQGRVKHADERTLIVQAGTAVTIDLPQDAAAFDLANGPIGVGTMVNITALPGATFQLLGASSAR